MHSAHHLNIFLPYCSLAAIALLSAAPCSLAGPLFETRCAYAEATLEQFLSWTRDDAAADVGPFCKYSTSEYWAYADYKYIAMLFQDLPSMFEVMPPPSDFDLNVCHLFSFKVLKEHSAGIFCAFSSTFFLERFLTKQSICIPEFFIMNECIFCLMFLFLSSAPLNTFLSPFSISLFSC